MVTSSSLLVFPAKCSAFPLSAGAFVWWQPNNQAPKEMLDQVCSALANDVLDVCTAYIQKTAVERAVPETDKRLANVGSRGHFLSLFLPVSLTVCLSLSLSFYLSLPPSLPPSLSPSPPPPSLSLSLSLFFLLNIVAAKE